MRHLKRTPKADQAEPVKKKSQAMLALRDIVIGMVVSICCILSASFYFQDHLEPSHASAAKQAPASAARGASK